MNRFLNWMLGILAGVVAVAALRPRGGASPSPASPDESADEPIRSPRWFDGPLSVTKAVVGRLREHHIPMIAGSLSYYAFLAIFPAAIAAISIYGLVLDPADLTAQVDSIAEALPEDTATFISTQLESIVDSSDSGLGVAAVISIVAALWSASAGTKALITGIDIAYETPENRSFIVVRGMALLITFGLIGFMASAASAVTFLPGLLDAVGAHGLIPFVEYGRWPIIFVMVVVGLGILYKIAPNRPASKSPWISVGAIVVAFLWVLATLGFSVYANNAGSLGETYGALSGIIALMLWFFISGLIVLTGAELNAELESRNLARVHTRNHWEHRNGLKQSRGD